MLIVERVASIGQGHEGGGRSSAWQVGISSSHGVIFEDRTPLIALRSFRVGEEKCVVNAEMGSPSAV